MSKKKVIKIEDLKIIDRELDRLTQLIDESLDLSRIESNKLNFQLKQFDLNGILDEVITQMELLVGLHRIEFVTVPNLWVNADPKRIKQVIINLFTNALKFSPLDSRIEIEAKIKRNHVVVSVSDHGIGMDEQQQALIFDRFYQIKHNSVDGLGLGLYISSEIIKFHHGKIWVQSIEGKGSIFYFSLPLKKSE